MENKPPFIRSFLTEFPLFNILAILSGSLSFFFGFFQFTTRSLHDYWSVVEVVDIYYFDVLGINFSSFLYLIGFSLAILTSIVQITKGYAKETYYLIVKLSFLLPFISLFVLYMIFPASNPHFTHPLHHNFCFVYYDVQYTYQVDIGFILGLLLPIFMIVNCLCNKSLRAVVLPSKK